MRSAAELVVLATIIAAVGCGDASVQWSDPVELRAPAASVHLVVSDAGQAALVPDSIIAMIPASLGACSSSVRATRGRTRVYGVWWRARPDSGIGLYTASSSDSGRTWGAATVIDTATADTRGCDRPAPAVTTVGDDLYVAYSMTASEGTGVFFAHFMSSMLHSPVAVIYGERLVTTAIATHGDRVAVAYEEPNGARAQVDVALSATQGHIFDQHATASREDDVARAPLVALSGRYVAVAWRPSSPSDSAGVVVARVGRLP